MIKTVNMALWFVFCGVAAGAQYRSQAPQFSFEYDETKWAPSELVAPTGEKDAKRTLVAVQKKDASKQYHARFSVVVDSLDKYKKEADPLAAYNRSALEFLKSQRFGNIRSKKGKVLENVNAEAFEMVGTQRDFGLTFRQVVVPKGEEVLILTAACRTEDRERLEAEIEQFFNTFRLPSS